MKKVWLFLLAVSLAAPLAAQDASADKLSPEEAAAVASILAKDAALQQEQAKEEDKIVLSEETKKQAFDEVNPPQTPDQQAPAAAQEAAPTAQPAVSQPAAVPETAPAKTEESFSEEEDDTPQEPLKCLTVAYIDIDEAFNEHPHTIAVKEQIRLKILSKEEEVRGAKALIDVLEAENRRLAQQVRELKPFYERIVVEPQPLLPKIEESADSLLLGNVLNRLTFSGAEILSTSPLNTPAELDDLTARIASNKKIIAERSFFIDNYKYTTREEILKLEKKEVNEILKDIYTEIKSFAKKRNVGAIVRKDELLYGEKPVNVTKDFITRLKKSKKYRKRGK